MLKEYNDSYFSFDGTHFIKMKKDYIARLKDTIDLIIISGRRDAIDEQTLNIRKLR